MFKTPFFSNKYVVVSENPYASVNGLDILRSGGNAVDAAVTIAFTLSITIPHLGGVGGDFFALYYDSDKGEVFCINGSGYAGKYQTLDLYRELGYETVPEKGVFSISLPGFVDGVYRLWLRFGSMEWHELLEKPYIMALNGFPITYTLVRGLERYKENLIKDPGSRFTYHLDEKLYPGKNIKFRNIARFIEVLKEDPRTLYDGDVATVLMNFINDYHILYDISDFKRYEAYFCDPIKIKFRGFDVYEVPPNSQGISTLQILKLLDGDGKDFDPLSYERILHYLNLFKKIYSIRDKYVGDPRYMEVSVDDLISNDFLNSYGDVDAESGECSDGDTTYFAVVDSEGNILSGIQSLFHPFGSKITEPTYGITLNSRASSFTLIDGHVNSIEPGKRPLHTLSTPILIGEDRVIAHGLSGGHFRPQLHTEIISNMLIYGMDPQDALEHARFVWVPGKDKVIVEEGFVIPPMKDVEMVKYGSRLGVAALLVSYHDSIKCGCVDIRGEGLAIGDV